MGRYRSRSRSLSPRRSLSPPRKKRYDGSPDRRSNRYRRSPAPSGLLVRNVALDTRPEDLRIPFERYGRVKDVYLPKNYYTGEPRGFGFVKFCYPEDAREAKEQLNRTIIGGREIRIVFAEENRKTPQEMRRSSRMSGRYGGSCRMRTLSRSPRRRYRSYSRSPSPARHYSRSISHSSSPHGRSLSSRETSHDEKRYKSSRKSPSSKETCPRNENYRSSRRSPHLREKFLLNGEDIRPSRRSNSPGELSPDVIDKKSKRRSSTPRGSSPDDVKNSKRTPSSRKFSPRIERKRKSNEWEPSLGDGSPDNKSGLNLKDRSMSNRLSGRSLRDGREFISDRSDDPLNRRSITRSRS